MRDTLIGVVLAVVFVAAMFALSQLHPHSAAQTYEQAAAEVTPGFVGTKQIGIWTVTCGQPQPGQAGGPKAAIPFSLNPSAKAPAAAAEQNQLARCRASLVDRRKDNPKAIIMVMSFRYTADQKRLAMIVRFPALGEKGQDLIIRVSKTAGIKLPIAQCSANEGCLAAGLLEQAGENLILAVPRGVLVFPAKKDGKSLGMQIPFVGLKDVLAALRRAES